MKTINHIAIIGAGALGVTFGSQLNKTYGKDRITFIADKKRVEKYRKQGLYLNDKRCDFSYQTPESLTGKVDFILFSVKYNALPEAISMAKQIADKDTIFLSLLNGISSEQEIKKAFPDSEVLFCVAQEMDSLKNENRIYYKNRGVLLIGSKENRMTASLRNVKMCLEGAQIIVRIPEDIHFALWNKLMINTGVNQAAAVYDYNYGALMKDETARKMMVDAMLEVKDIANCEGVKLTDDDIEGWMKVLNGLNPQGMPSMRQDTMAKRKTEVELFSGTICRLGKRHQILTPVNDFFYREIKNIESNEA